MEQREEHTETIQNAGTPHHLRWAAWGIIAAVVVAIVLIAHLLLQGARYRELRVTDARTMENALSSTYCEMHHNVLRYGTDSAALMDRDQQTLWEISYKMAAPTAAVRNGTVALYDVGGSDVIICDERGEKGRITTDMPVQKADVSAKGTVATLQSDDNNVWIRYYSSTGEEISAIKTSMADPGYPMDFALSDDGMLLAVSYLSNQDNEPASTVTFYQFGTFGQDQMDNIVGEFPAEGALVPEVAYLNGSTAVAFRDDGFVLYRGDARPDRVAEEHVDEEIESIFWSDDHIGLITRKETGSEPFSLHIYDLDGTERASAPLDFIYDSVEFSGTQISLYKDNTLCVYDLSARKKFEGACEGNVKQLFALDTRQYIASDEEGIRWLRLK